MTPENPTRGVSPHFENTDARRMEREWTSERARGRARRVAAEARTAYRRVQCWSDDERDDMGTVLSVLAAELEEVPKIYRGESWRTAVHAVWRAADYHGAEVWHDGRPWALPSTLNTGAVLPVLCAALFVLAVLSAVLP